MPLIESTLALAQPARVPAQLRVGSYGIHQLSSPLQVTKFVLLTSVIVAVPTGPANAQFAEAGFKMPSGIVAGSVDDAGREL